MLGGLELTGSCMLCTASNDHDGLAQGCHDKLSSGTGEPQGAYVGILRMAIMSAAEPHRVRGGCLQGWRMLQYTVVSVWWL